MQKQPGRAWENTCKNNPDMDKVTFPERKQRLRSLSAVEGQDYNHQSVHSFNRTALRLRSGDADAIKSGDGAPISLKFVITNEFQLRLQAKASTD